MPPSISGVGVSRHSKPLFFAAALLSVVVAYPVLGARLPQHGFNRALYRGPLEDLS